MSETKIQWTDATWNPLRGCSIISPGCQECYAMKIAHRFDDPDDPTSTFHGLTEIGPNGPRWNGNVRTIPEKLDEPLHWKKPRRIFVNSMSDLFHDGVPFDYVDQVFAVMALCPQHTFQVLTKRPERMRKYFDRPELYANVLRIADQSIRPKRRNLTSIGISDPAKHPAKWIWLGVSVERRDYKWRIDELRETPAAVRFLSIEPLLEDIGELDLTGIHWVIIGGESGQKARPFHAQWARNIIKQCKIVRVPAFMKQMGGNAYERNDRIADIWHYADGSDMEADEAVGGSRYQGESVRLRLKDRKGGLMAEWAEDLRIRQFPQI